MADKPYWSATRLEMLCRCGEAYRQRYMENRILPPGIAMAKGTGVDRAAANNFIQKMESHADMSERDIVAMAVEAFDAQIRSDGILLTEEESTRGAARVLDTARDDVAEMASIHAVIQAPDYQPVAVQQEVRIELPGKYDLLGYLDLQDDRDRITDFKTSGKSKTQDEADASIQLTVYAAGFQSMTGRPAAEVRLDTIVQTRSRIDRQVVVSRRTQADFAALAARINAATRAVEAGNFLPATPGAWWCAPRWCGYWSTCPYVNSERKALVQISSKGATQ